MKKLLVLMVMASLLVMGVMLVGAQQIVQVEGEKVINFSLNSVDFGPMFPGETVNDNSEITLDISNNVDFIVSIKINESDFVLDGILFDLSTYGGAADEKLGDGPLSAEIDDTDTTEPGAQQVKQIPVSLTMPTGALPGSRERAIVYTIVT